MTITILSPDGSQVMTDTPPMGMDPVITQPSFDDVQCEDCGTDVPLTPGGRQFRKCIDCRRAARGVTGTTRTGGGKRWQDTLSSQLNDMLTGVGTLIESLANPIDGKIIKAGSPKLCESLMLPAEQNPKVRKTLTTIANGGAWGAVALAASAIVLPILANHQLLPMQIKQRQATAQRANAQQAAREATDPTMVGHVSV